MEAGLASFDEHYHHEYRSLMLKKLGFEKIEHPEALELFKLTIQFLQESKVEYHKFFYEMARTFSSTWRDDPSLIMVDSGIVPISGTSQLFDSWCILYHKLLNNFDREQINEIAQTLIRYNPQTAILRPVIESIWEPIVQEDNWQPFYELLTRIQSGK